MAGNIFISYRREDTRADARLVDQRLRAAFGSNRIFFDVDTIQKGRDFRKVLAEALDSSNVLLAVIGPTWLSVTDATGRRRVDDPNDFVRLEIANALKRDIAVIPVLVGGAKMPREHELPADLQSLAFRQAAIITHDNFPRDVESLERDVRALVGARPSNASGSRRAVLAMALLMLIAAIGLALQRSGTIDQWLAMAVPASTVDVESAKRRAAVEAADKSRLEAERRQTDAARREQETNAAAAAAKRQADEREKARAAAQAKFEADIAATKSRADEALRKSKEVERNRPLEFNIWSWANLTNECQIFGVPELEVTKAPRYGTVQFRDENVPIKIVSSKEREHCIGRVVKGRIANYVLNEKDRDIVGTDQLSIRIKFGSRGESLEDFDINLAQRNAIRTKTVAKQPADSERSRAPEMRLFGWVNVSNDCQAIGRPELDLAKAPRFGSIQFRDEDVLIKIVTGKEHEHCMGRTLPGRVAYYTANEIERGNAAADHMTFRVRHWNGTVTLDDIDLDLLQHAASRTRSSPQ